MQLEHAASWLCDYCMAATFAASVFGKIRAMTDTRQEMSGHGLLPERLVPGAAWAVLAGEAALAAVFGIGGLLEGVKEPAAIAALAVMSGLTWRRGRRSAAGSQRQCGCFGANHPLGRRPLLRNAVLIGIAAAGWLLPRPAASASDLVAFALAVLAAVWLLEALKLHTETGGAASASRGRAWLGLHARRASARGQTDAAVRD